MKYAVIGLAGTQHVVSEGEILVVNRLPYAENEKFSVADVMLIVDGDVRKIGTPLLDGAHVDCTVVTHSRGEKIRVATFKAKSRTRKVRGHRQEQTQVRIEAINA